MEVYVEDVAVVPFFIAEVGVAYFVGRYNPEDICLDEADDDFAFRHHVVNNEMEVFFNQEGVISWFERNEYSAVKFFFEFGRDFLNVGFWDFEYILAFDYSLILDHLYPKN